MNDYICEQLPHLSGAVRLYLTEPDGTRHLFTCVKTKQPKLQCTFDYTTSNDKFVPLPREFSIELSSVYSNGPEPSEITDKYRTGIIIFDEMRYTLKHHGKPIMDIYWLDGMLFTYIIKTDTTNQTQ